jgi:hypothetical protein
MASEFLGQDLKDGYTNIEELHICITSLEPRPLLDQRVHSSVMDHGQLTGIWIRLTEVK